MYAKHFNHDQTWYTEHFDPGEKVHHMHIIEMTTVLNCQVITKQ